MQCPYCGNPVREGATVCPTCGTQFRMVRPQPVPDDAFLGLKEDQVIARAGKPDRINVGEIWLSRDPARRGWLQGRGSRVRLISGRGPVPTMIPALIPYQVWTYESKDWILHLYLTEYSTDREPVLEPCGDDIFESRETPPRPIGPRRVVQAIRYRADTVF